MDNFELKNLKQKKIHFVGIGGVSMSALAQILHSRGYDVQGSDEVENQEVVKLKKKGIKVFMGHNEENVIDSHVVVYTSAIHEDNPELKHALKNGLLVIKRTELLGAISDSYKNVIAVAGSHGKTTTTAMISEVFLRAKLNPTIHIGGVLNSINSNYKIGNKKFFITENCEYMDNFLEIKPNISVILNIDSDHLDYFKTLNGVKNSFLKYALQTKMGGVNIVCDQDENSNEIMELNNSISFGYKKTSDVYASNIKQYKAGYYSFNVYFEKCKLGNIKLNIAGKHNILNALASILVSIICGIDFTIIKSAIESFSGVKRRCQKLGEINGVCYFHDYAHHPKQIKEMITAGKEMIKPENKLFVVFEPHTFSRTKFLMDDFVNSLSLADEIVLLPVYSAREQESEGKTSFDLYNKFKCNNVYLYNDYNSAILHLKHRTNPGDLVMILGAGTIEKVGDMIFSNHV